jgi:hypothetical protein
VVGQDGMSSLSGGTPCGTQWHPELLYVRTTAYYLASE